jgi:serine/threonine protein kinase
VTRSQFDAEVWARVNEVFHSALELPAGERVAMVRRECADTETVRDEVLSLLAAHDRADRLLPDSAVTSASLPESGAGAQRVGELVGQYRVSRVLGQGGMGVVYLAEDQRLGRAVALKAISGSVAADPGRRERLRREARAAAALTHPGIATVYALEEFGNDLFIASEFIAGETLRDEIGQGPADATRVLDTAIELADALAAAHDRGVVHRDLKPENVIRTPSGHVKILDFGLARLRDVPPELAHLTDDGKVFGTPGYMSPEQIRRGNVDARSDLFAVGILLHELLTGVHPFAGADSASTIARILESEPAITNGAISGSGDVSGVRYGLTGIIRILLRKDPAGRFASAHELLRALDRLRSGERLPDQATTVSRALARKWWRFHMTATSVAYAGLLVPVGLAGDDLADHRLGVLLFLVALAAAVAAITLRMHLLFLATSLPHQWASQLVRSRVGLRVADLGFVAVLVTSGLVVFKDHNIKAAILVGAGVLALLGATIIEPMTTRAALDES